MVCASLVFAFFYIRKCRVYDTSCFFMLDSISTFTVLMNCTRVHLQVHQDFEFKTIKASRQVRIQGNFGNRNSKRTVVKTLYSNPFYFFFKQRIVFCILIGCGPYESCLRNPLRNAFRLQRYTNLQSQSDL